ncbi:hypothetical protein JW930_00055 [Candidatus Woesearchaeota archaeon]|nr:hypothetical protein [Candidatus Woesearchaeota archaeon]
MKLITSKKGMEFTTFHLGTLIMVIIGIIIVIFLIWKWNLSQGKCMAASKELCMASVLANSKARVPVVNDEIYAVNCPTKYLTIGLEGYEEETTECKGGDDKYFKECGKPNQAGTSQFNKCFFNKTNELIASRIFNCWEQFGAGNLKVFSEYEVDRQCIVCEIIEFSEEARAAYGGEYIGARYPQYSLDEYMRTTKPSAAYTASYYELTVDALDVFQPQIYDYDMQGSYAVLFVAVNQAHVQDMLGDAWSWFQDKVPWLLGRSSDEPEILFVNALHFVPQEDVQNMCDKLI